MTQQPDDQVEQKPAWWMPRYIKTQAATITELRQRVAELEGLCVEAEETLAHAAFFIKCREKMHLAGRELYAETQAKLAAIRNRSNDHAD